MLVDSPNTAGSPEERATALLAELSLDQKLAQVSCYFPVDISDTAAFRASFPDGVGEVSCLEMRDATDLDDVAGFQRAVQAEAMAASGHGIPAIFHMEGLCGAYLPGATSFPSGIGRGSSWDPELERAVGAVVGRQERSVGISHTLAPVLDISRDSRMGRQGETYGEDPALAAAMGVAFVNGLQEEATQGLRSEAVAKHFLGSHHTEGGIHGAHCDIPDRLLVEVYGRPFQAAITEAGLRGVMPCYNAIGGEPASSSLRLLTTLLRDEMGFDGVAISDYGAIGNLHIVQRVADSFPAAGVAALRAGMDAELHVPQALSTELRDWFSSGKADLWLLDRAVHRMLTTKFRMGLFEHPFTLEGDVLRQTFTQPGDTATSLQSARESIVLLRNDGALPMTGQIRILAVIGCHAVNPRFFFGGYTHLSMAEGKRAAHASMAGLAGTTASNGNPLRTVSGTAIQADDDPEFDDVMRRQKPGIRSLVDEFRARLPGTDVRWAKGYPIAGRDDSGHAEALALAQQADVVVLTLGGKHGTSSIASMGEGIDATDINLPPCQDELIIKLAATGKPLIGIHLDGRPVSSQAADDHLSALVEAWNPAEYGALAIVDVILGDIDPTGRLPVTVARNAGQIGIYYNHPNGSSWDQGESIGFPDYVDSPHTPRYCFGHGLSYTAFGYLALTVTPGILDPDGAAAIHVLVRNTGNRPGTEVVQLYIRDPYASMSRPVLELAGFQRVQLEPGEEAAVQFDLHASQLAFLDADKRWLVEAGAVDVLVGASSQDIRLRASLRVARDLHIEGRNRAFFARSSVSRQPHSPLGFSTADLAPPESNGSSDG